jgi:hypothetical protein
MLNAMSTETLNLPDQKSHKSGKKLILIVFLICFVPFFLAAAAYVNGFFKGRNNYGTLIDPQLDVPAHLQATRLGGEKFDISELKGKWILFQVAASDCKEACQQMMFYQRQIRTSTGKEKGRLERVVFLIDDAPVETMLLRQFEGVHFVRISQAQLTAWLPVAAERQSDPVAIQEHVFLADPLGHVMMRFPANPDAAKMRKDISKLLWASRIG